MTIKNVKKFVKEHKKGIIGGAVAIAGVTALTMIGIKCRTPKLTDFTDSVDAKFLDLCNTVEKACKDCTVYVPTTLEQTITEIDNARVIDNKYFLEAPDKKLFEVKNVILFGNLVET